MTVLKGDALGVPAHDVAGEVARPVLDHHAHLDDDVGVGPGPSLLFEVVEDVAHGSSDPRVGRARVAALECATGAGAGRGMSHAVSGDTNPTA